MRIYDSYDALIKEFVPIEKGRVRMYVCGLTPYDDMHVGHLRTNIFFDVVRRYFKHKGYDVFYVQNITDVEDKVFNRARELNVDPLQLSESVMSRALNEMAKANVERPTMLEKVSDNVPAIIKLIEKIIENKYAYISNGEVYFSVLKFEKYGKLSKQKIGELILGERVEVNENKRHPLDFALWKKSGEGELEYDSPWGKGRPGWHIECSAISTKYLGESIDVHGGGRDLIFPHHENEIAQSESAYGKRFVNYWMHTGFLTINGEKMSKSLGNFITAAELLKKYDANTVRWCLLTRHYRSPIDFDYEYFEDAKKRIERIKETVEFARVAIERGVGAGVGSEISGLCLKFHNAMDNDFDTPSALAAVNEIVHLINAWIKGGEIGREGLREAVDELIKLLGILGIGIELKSDKKYVERLKEYCKKYGIALEEETGGLHPIVESLLALRDRMRADKNYKEADAIRKVLLDAGIVVEDADGKSLWRRG